MLGFTNSGFFTLTYGLCYLLFPVSLPGKIPCFFGVSLASLRFWRLFFLVLVVCGFVRFVNIYETFFFNCYEWYVILVVYGFGVALFVFLRGCASSDRTLNEKMLVRECRT